MKDEMERPQKLRKFITPANVLAVLFLGCIFYLSACNFYHVHPKVAALLKTVGTTAEKADKLAVIEQFSVKTFSKIEKTLNEEFYRKLKFINLHGAIQRMLCKREVGDFDVVKDSHGSLHLGVAGSRVLNKDAKYTPEKLQYIKPFLDFCKQENVDVTYVITPTKVQAGFTELPTGVTSFKNKNQDTRRDIFRQFGMDVLDLREEIDAEKLDKSKLFFKTDHHWTTETAFWAHDKVLSHLVENHELEIPNKEKISNIENFEKRIYPQFFLGSSGIRVGPYYAGLDDYTLIWPSFPTQLTLMDPNRSKKAIKGSFYETVIDHEQLREGDEFQNRRYGAYLTANRAKRVIKNPDGKNTVVIVQDSFGRPLSSFLSLAFEKTVIFDYRFPNKTTIREYIKQNKDVDSVIFINQIEKKYIW